jgi:hypothetical protein
MASALLAEGHPFKNTPPNDPGFRPEFLGGFFLRPWDLAECVAWSGSPPDESAGPVAGRAIDSISDKYLTEQIAVTGTVTILRCRADPYTAIDDSVGCRGLGFTGGSYINIPRRQLRGMAMSSSSLTRPQRFLMALYLTGAAARTGDGTIFDIGGYRLTIGSDPTELTFTAPRASVNYSKVWAGGFPQPDEGDPERSIIEIIWDAATPSATLKHHNASGTETISGSETVGSGAFTAVTTSPMTFGGRSGTNGHDFGIDMLAVYRGADKTDDVLAWHFANLPSITYPEIVVDGPDGGTPYEVQNLDTSGTGSLAGDTNGLGGTGTGKRIVTFSAALEGFIDSPAKNVRCSNRRIIGSPNVIIRGGPYLHQGSNHIHWINQTFAPGDDEDIGDGLQNRDGLVVEGGMYILIEHCLLTRTIDELMSAFQTANWPPIFAVRLHRCILAEAFRAGGHLQGDHNYGPVGNNAVHFVIDHSVIGGIAQRAPKFVDCWGADSHNNLIYDWSSWGLMVAHDNHDKGGAERITHMRAAHRNNLLLPGPSTNSTALTGALNADALGRGSWCCYRDNWKTDGVNFENDTRYSLSDVQLTEDAQASSLKETMGFVSPYTPDPVDTPEQREALFNDILDNAGPRGTDGVTFPPGDQNAYRDASRILQRIRARQGLFVNSADPPPALGFGIGYSA